MVLRAGAHRAVRATRPRIALQAGSALTTELKGELLQLVSAQDLSEDISSDISQKMDVLVDKISATASGPVFSKEEVSSLRRFPYNVLKGQRVAHLPTWWMPRCCSKR